MPHAKYTTLEQIEEMRKEILHEKQKMRGIPTPDSSSKKNAAKRKLAAKALGWTVFLSIALLLTVNLVFIHMARSRGEIPSLLGGFQLFSVESGSMDPTFSIGSVILCRKPNDAGSLKKNDIVTFRTLSGSVVTHRIVEVITDINGNTSYRTKGDNPRNSTDQELLTPDRVLAVFIARIPLT